jgi:hypothetical protein
MTQFATGDDIGIEADLTINDAAPPSVASVKAALILPDRSAKAAGTSDVTCTIVATTTAYVRVRAQWLKATTGSIVPGEYLAEFQVTDGSGFVRTYKAFSIEVVKGIVV